jgi:endonuclease/exonuclease/phosphatase family metal-dependent hydrolase
MKLISWNVQWFRGVDGRVDVSRVLRAARELADFDVCCLQEVAVGYPDLPGGGAGDQVAQLRAALPGYEVCFGAAVDERVVPATPGVAAPGARRRFGNVIASRLPVTQLQQHALPYPPQPGVQSMPRLALVATLLAPWGPLRVATTHLEYYSQAMRLAQTAELRRLQAQAAALARHPPAPGDETGPFRARPHTPDCMLCGDFNCDATSAEYRTLLEHQDGAPAFVDAWCVLHGQDPQPPTFRVHDRSDAEPPMACDFVFVTDTLTQRLRDIVIDGTTQASDHQPVSVTLA